MAVRRVVGKITGADVTDLEGNRVQFQIDDLSVSMDGVRFKSSVDGVSDALGDVTVELFTDQVYRVMFPDGDEKTFYLPDGDGDADLEQLLGGVTATDAEFLRARSYINSLLPELVKPYVDEAAALVTAGAAGKSVIAFPRAPLSTDGNDGDVYVNSANGDIYSKAAGAWGAPIGNLTGPQGPQGTTGSDGLPSYAYVRYAQDDTGTGFTDTPTAGTRYIAVVTTNSPTPPDAAAFAGKWVSLAQADLGNFAPKTAAALEDELLLAAQATVTLTQVSELLSAPIIDAAIEALRDELPTAVGFNPRGPHILGAQYQPNDLVEYVTDDGRIGSAVARIVTTEPPTNTEHWQTIALGTAGGAGAAGYTEIRLSAQADGNYTVDLAREGRYIIVRDGAGPGTLNFTNLASLGNAVVAIRTSVSGTPSALSFPSYVEWEGGSTPVLTETAGRGDVFLFRCWDGQKVIGVRSQENVFFKGIPLQSPADSAFLHQFRAGAAMLQNALKPGTNDFVVNTGASRVPYGIDYAAGQESYTNVLVNPDTGTVINFNEPWAVGFVYAGAWAVGRAQVGALGMLTLASPTVGAKYARPYIQCSAAPTVRLAARSDVVTTGAVGPKDAGGVPTVELRLTDLPMDFFVWEYDGAGQYQLYNVGTGEVLWDTVAGANATNRYVNGDSTIRLDYAAGMRLSTPTIRRPSDSISPTVGNARYDFLIRGRVTTLAERRELYNHARDYIAAIDPTGPQLAALV